MRSIFVVLALLLAALYIGTVLVMLPRLRAPPSAADEPALPTLPTLPPVRSAFLNNQSLEFVKLAISRSAASSVAPTADDEAPCGDAFATQLLNKMGAAFEFDTRLDGRALPWRFDCSAPLANAESPPAIYSRDRAYAYVPLANLTKSRLIGSAEQDTITQLINGPLMRAYLPARDPFFVRPKPFRRCAVVGSSGLLLNSSLGAAIDAHDVVLRFNWPLLAGYERDVGRKTTHMLVNRKSMHASHWPPYASQRVDYAAQNVTVVALLHFVDEFTEWLHWARRERAPPLLAVSPDLRRLAAVTLRDALRANLRASVGDKIELVVASTGFIGALLALAACEHVTLAGFGTSAHSGNGHYWAPAGDVTREWSIHDFDGEQHYYRLLELKRTYPPWLAHEPRASFEFVQPAEGAKVLLDDLLRNVPAEQALPDPKAAERAFYSGADRAAKFQAHREAQINHKPKATMKPKPKR